MFEQIVFFLETHIVPLGAIGVFLASILEEVIAPIPSTAVIFVSGFLFLKDLSGLLLWKTLLFTILIPAIVGITIGSLFVYALGFYLGKPFFVRWGKYLGVTWEDIEKAKRFFTQGPRDEIVLFSVRAVPVIPSVVISGLSGLLRIPLRSYIFATLLGLIPRILVLSYLGFVAGDAYEAHIEKIGMYEDRILFAIIVAVLLFIGYRVFSSHKVVH